MKLSKCTHGTIVKDKNGSIGMIRCCWKNNQQEHYTPIEDYVNSLDDNINKARGEMSNSEVDLLVIWVN